MTVSVWQDSLLRVILKGQPDSPVGVAVFFNPCLVTGVGFSRTGNLVSSDILPCMAQSNVHCNRPDAPVVIALELNNGKDSLFNEGFIFGGRHDVKVSSSRVCLGS